MKKGSTPIDGQDFGPLARQAERVKDAYIDLAKKHDIYRASHAQATVAVEAYRRARFKLFLKILKERALECCGLCEHIGATAECTWGYALWKTQTDEGYDGSTVKHFLVRLCDRCRNASQHGRNRHNPSPDARRHVVEYAMLAERDDATGVWQFRNFAGFLTKVPVDAEVREQPLKVPHNLPVDLGLPPDITLDESL